MSKIKSHRLKSLCGNSISNRQAAKQAAEKVGSGKVLVAQPLLAVWFSGLSHIRDAIHRENRTAKSGCATFSTARKTGWILDILRHGLKPQVCSCHQALKRVLLFAIPAHVVLSP